MASLPLFTFAWQHPSKHQLKLVFSRYFFALDLDHLSASVSESCDICSALLKVPSALHEQSSSDPPTAVGREFAADIVKRHRQLILVFREIVSSYTLTMFVTDERKSTLKLAIISLASLVLPSRLSPIHVRVDCAVSLTALSKDDDLSSRGIVLVVGSPKNLNKNPVAESAIEELGLELLRLAPEGGPVTEVLLKDATASLNSRLRLPGLSAYEMWTHRDQVTGDQLPFNDREVIEQKYLTRSRNHLPSALSKANGRHACKAADVIVGDLVYLYAERSKLSARDRYLVVSIDGGFCGLRKFTHRQFRNKVYNVRLSDVYPVVKSGVHVSEGPIRGMAGDSESSGDEEDMIPVDVGIQEAPGGITLGDQESDIDISFAVPDTGLDAHPVSSEALGRPRRRVKCPDRYGEWTV